MVWMPLINKQKNTRRRQSQSPSSSSDSSSRKAKNRTIFGSKHKRRIFRKGEPDASIMSSKSSGQMESAAWRVENIRASPPTAEEWWDGGCAPEPMDGGKDSGGLSQQIVRVSSRHNKFRNRGYETWVKAREEWNQQTVETVPPKPLISEKERSILVKRLRKASTQRTYQLPRNLALPDIIGIYNDVWNG